MRISREQVAELPIGRFAGDVVLVESAADLERAMRDLRAERVVGFDTETRPAFKPGQSYLPSVVQLATARAVYVFQVQQQDFSAPISEILGEERLLKIGVSVADDLKSLKKLFPFEERSVLDLGKAAKARGIQQSGVRNLAAMYLGFRIPKGQKTSNWAARRLSASQILYVATDAWACRELYLRFHELGMLEPVPTSHETRPAAAPALPPRAPRARPDQA
jgi:ribonuclease D